MLSTCVGDAELVWEDATSYAGGCQRVSPVNELRCFSLLSYSWGVNELGDHEGDHEGIMRGS